MQDAKTIDNLKQILVTSFAEFSADTPGFNESGDQVLIGVGIGEPAIEGYQFAAVLGFSGEAVKGSLIVSCEKTLLQTSHPNLAMGMPVEDPDLSDWIGEIANQILGRFKNKCSAAGVVFSMSTPTALMGSQLSVNNFKDGHLFHIRSTLPHGKILLLLSITCFGTFKLLDSLPASTAAEGGSILF